MPKKKKPPQTRPTNNNLTEPDDDYEEIEFIPCSKCDGHPACEDFGCAYELGLGKLVKKEPGYHWD